MKLYNTIGEVWQTLNLATPYIQATIGLWVMTGLSKEICKRQWKYGLGAFILIFIYFL